MRTRVLWRRCRAGVPILFAASLALAVSGCGGGGGGGGNSGNNPPPAANTLTGNAVDAATGAGIGGVKVTIPGTAFTATSDATGKFVISNIPLTATTFETATPNASVYSTIVTYEGNNYETSTSRTGGPCTMPLPPLVKGANVLPASVLMYNIGNGGGPPPPPVTSCP
ncbi:MAG: hypothetical protein KGJ62_08505 [Armatimonadetes bacterium]|nr:hypothetical protein [Armatimonadota bacterium]MDE2205067.1 hypothetical protein [Armatimonadota bacterium]